MKRDFACLQCGESSAELHLADCRDLYLGKPQRADYHRCRGCGLVQQHPLPADTSSFYDAYPIHDRKSLAYRVMRALVMNPSYFDLRRYLRARDGDAGRPVLIDLGCGDGWFLEQGAAQPVERIGFEIAPPVAAALAERLAIPVYSDEAALLRDHAGRADVVTMHFVVEHVTDLHRTFELVGKLLRPGGLFHFTVPNIGSWEARLFGRRWHNLDCPRHISFPEEGAVRALAARWRFAWQGKNGLPFPNGIAASVPAVLTGRFRFPLFLLALPFGIVLARLFPSGSLAYRLVRS